MKTYDLKDAHRGRASFWHNVREVLRRWLDRERELMALRNAVGMMSEARESVDDALMIVESYGPWGADLNDAHRRQIVLADEVVRLRGLYEMAVRGRAEMRSALRQERRAEELHEGCQMPMEQARELAASESSPDWYARGQDWALADAMSGNLPNDWTAGDIARAYAAGARSGEGVLAAEVTRLVDKCNSYIVDNARLAEQVENLRAALQWYADGLHFDKASPDAWDTVSGEPQNWWCDEAGTATVEDGSIAAMVLRGELTGAQVQALD